MPTTLFSLAHHGVAFASALIVLIKSLLEMHLQLKYIRKYNNL